MLGFRKGGVLTLPGENISELEFILSVFLHSLVFCGWEENISETSLNPTI